MRHQVRVILTAVATAGVLALTGCGSSETDTSPQTPAPTSSATPSAPSPSGKPAKPQKSQPAGGATTDATTSVETSPPVAQEKGGVRMITEADCTALGGTTGTLGEHGRHVECAGATFTVYTTQDEDPLSKDPGVLPQGWKRIEAKGWTYGLVAIDGGKAGQPQFMTQDRTGTVLSCRSQGSTAAALEFCNGVKKRLTT